jgi:putative membrane protein
MMMGFGWGFGGFGMILMMLFWVAIVLLAVWLLSRLFPGTRTDAGAQAGQGNSATSSNALEILKQRYARGEISKTEYEDIRRGLQA